MTCSKTPKVGDIVHVRVRVFNIRLDGSAIDVQPRHYGGSSGYICCLPTDILKVEERPLAVGDRVRGTNWVSIGPPAKIIAIDCEDAWLRWPEGTSGVYKLSHLERVD